MGFAIVVSSSSGKLLACNAWVVCRKLEAYSMLLVTLCRFTQTNFLYRRSYHRGCHSRRRSHGNDWGNAVRSNGLSRWCRRYHRLRNRLRKYRLNMLIS